MFLGVDYAPGILTVLHYVSLKNQVQHDKECTASFLWLYQDPLSQVVMVCLAIILLYPLAVPIFYALFLVAHVRKDVSMRSY